MRWKGELPKSTVDHEWRGIRRNSSYPDSDDENKAFVCDPRHSWCGREDSNLHALRRQPLKLVRLPIPPRPRAGKRRLSSRPAPGKQAKRPRGPRRVRGMRAAVGAGVPDAARWQGCRSRAPGSEWQFAHAKAAIIGTSGARRLARDGGPVDYDAAVAAMQARTEAIAAGHARELVWLLEHPPLYTAGTSAGREDLLLPDRFPVYRTGRGGQYTYHGPGQRIVYVMLDVGRRRRRRARVRVGAGAVDHRDAGGVRRAGADTHAGQVGVWVTGRTRAGAARQDRGHRAQAPALDQPAWTGASTSIRISRTSTASCRAACASMA